MTLRLALRALAGSLAFLVLAAPAWGASPSLFDTVHQWLPDPPGATWTYTWRDNQYAPTPTTERYAVGTANGLAFPLTWTTDGQGNGSGSVSSQGEIDYQRSNAGVVAATWASTPPPPQFPILCPSAGGCGNSLASTHYMLIWGTRSPILMEPLTLGTRWSSTGGASNDVASVNRYLGRERVVVPAFPHGVEAAKVQSDITQAGALGDPYGSGIRTVWWVYGVGPVKVVFQHAGGDLQQAELTATSLRPLAAPPDADYLPLDTGAVSRFRYTNSRYLRRGVVQTFTVSAAVNDTARVDVKGLTGPLRVAGAYIFSTRLDGTTNISGATSAATRLRFPPLGPRFQPRSRRRHFFTAYDLMVYGFNPVLPAYPRVGDVWTSSRNSRDFSVFGVVGRTRIVGRRWVTVPAGRFRALVVRSELRQAGYRYGSGERTMWFAPGVGLVKLVFRHADRSVSTVVRLR